MIQPLLESINRIKWITLLVLCITIITVVIRMKMSEGEKTRRYLIVQCVVVVVLGVVSVIEGYCQNLIPLQYVTYGVKTTATIIGNEPSSTEDYIYVVEYDVNGKKTRARIGTSNKEKADVLESGSTVEIYYLPEKVTDIVFADIDTKAGNGFLVIGIVACVFAIIVLLKTERNM